jgi:PEGA domain
VNRVIAVLLCGFSVAACSTSLGSFSFMRSSVPPSQTLRIASEPPGADAKSSQGQSCRTPCEVKVEPGSELSVTFSLGGYQSQTVNVRQEEPDRLTPNPVYAELVPASSAAPPKKVPKKKKPESAAVEAPPRPAPASPPATNVPSSVEPAASEPAATAPQYPWPSR